MRGVIVFALVGIVGCFFLAAARVVADEVDDLTAVLTSGSWAKEIGNSKMPDRYVYSFAKDGTYKSVLYSDFTPRPTTTGRWELIKGKDNKIHLRLKNEEGKYAWLEDDSVVRYDKEKDVLRISGAKYAGEQPMRREKLASTSKRIKDAPPAAPVKARLLVKKDTYVLDLAGKNAEEFARAIQSHSQPAPQVDLTFELQNTTAENIKIWVGGGSNMLTLDLQGPGAVNQAWTNYVLRADIGPTIVTLAAGKAHSVPVKSLSSVGRYNGQNRHRACYWTKPGEYTLRATFETAIYPAAKDAPAATDDFWRITIMSEAVKLTVR
jgi:hypothetical protein